MTRTIASLGLLVAMTACTPEGTPQPIILDGASIQNTCSPSSLPESEIRGTRVAPIVTDTGYEQFHADWSYMRRDGWGSSWSGAYRLCDASICVQIDGEAERCRALRRVAKARYIDPSGQVIVFEPTPD